MITLPISLRIGVLRGGPSPEYDVSLQSGGHVLQNLSNTHKPFDIFISKDGTWHIHGIERSRERILKQLDVVWNALHGSYGEDGKLQELLSHHGIKYTGSDKFASKIAMNKTMAKEQIKVAGIKTPVSIIVRREDSMIDKAKEIFNSIPHPLMVKPTCGGSSIGLYIVRTFNELLSALEQVLSVHGSAIVEEYISGKSVSGFITEDFRNQPIYTFPAIVTSSGSVSTKETRAVEDMAKQVHNMLQLSHYSKSDFIVSPRRGIYFLEVNTVPKLEKKSLLLQALETVGVDTVHFIHHMLSLAVNRK